MTIKELAKILNVSISTVSKALNDSDEISPETIKRVKETAKLYGYRANFIAKSLKSQSTNTLGVIIPDVLNYFFVQLLHGIENEARKQGYNVMTCISHEKISNEKANIIALTNGQVDGILFCPSEETQNSIDLTHIEELSNNNVPFVTFDRSLHDIKASGVLSNDFFSAYDATNYLIKNGGEKTYLFASHVGLSVMKERIKGFKQAMREHHILKDSSVVEISEEKDYEVFIKEFLASTKVDGILTIDELLSVKAVKIATKLKINIPKTLKVIGFSNGEISAQFSPSISSVDQRAGLMGKEAVTLMIEMLKNENSREVVVKTVPAVLIHRETTKI